MFPTAKPRAHHYRFAHHALQTALLEPGPELGPLVAAGLADGALISSWYALGEELPDSERLIPDGLHAELVDIAGHESVLVTLPEAVAPGEAWFVAVMPCEPREQRRFFTLESSWDVVNDIAGTVVGEWRGEHHINLVDGTTATADAFIELLTDRFG